MPLQGFGGFLGRGEAQELGGGRQDEGKISYQGELGGMDRQAVEENEGCIYYLRPLVSISVFVCLFVSSSLLLFSSFWPLLTLLSFMSLLSGRRTHSAFPTTSIL